MQNCYLITIGETGENMRYLLEEGANSIGRGKDNTIPLRSPDNKISKHHAIIYKYSNEIKIQDLKSTNGTFVNGKRIEEELLQPEDSIRFGKKDPTFKLVVSTGDISRDASMTDKPSEKKEEDLEKKHEDFEITFDPPEEKLPESESCYKPDPLLPQNGTMTLKMEQKLKDNSIATDELQSLMKNEKRLQKILDRDTIDDSRASFLIKAWRVNRKMRKKWLVVVSVVGVLSFLIILVLSVKMLHYKHIVNEGVALKEQLDKLERKIFQLNQETDPNSEKIDSLVTVLLKTQEDLDSIKGNIREEDLVVFYDDTVEYFLHEILESFGETNFHVPPIMKECVKKYIDIYTGKYRNFTLKSFKRKPYYFPLIRKVFIKNNLPIELAYVSVIESGLDTNISSPAGAKGLWQFMPKTGKDYQLNIDLKNGIDERTNAEKSTEAAARYFINLISLFGTGSDIMLAMAAYNAGEGRIRGLLRKIKNPMRERNFWTLYRMGNGLARETKEYVPKILSMMILHRHAEYYGFKSDNRSSFQ